MATILAVSSYTARSHTGIFPSARSAREKVGLGIRALFPEQCAGVALPGAALLHHHQHYGDVVCSLVGVDFAEAGVMCSVEACVRLTMVV